MCYSGPQTRERVKQSIDEQRILQWLYSNGRQAPSPYILKSLPDATELVITDIDRWHYETHFKDKYKNYADYQLNHGKRRSARLS